MHLHCILFKYKLVRIELETERVSIVITDIRADVTRVRGGSVIVMLTTMQSWGETGD